MPTAEDVDPHVPGPKLSSSPTLPNRKRRKRRVGGVTMTDLILMKRRFTIQRGRKLLHLVVNQAGPRPTEVE